MTSSDIHSIERASGSRVLSLLCWAGLSTWLPVTTPWVLFQDCRFPASCPLLAVIADSLALESAQQYFLKLPGDRGAAAVGNQRGGCALGTEEP